MNILTSKKGFDDFDILEFKKIFAVIERIIEPDTPTESGPIKETDTPTTQNNTPSTQNNTNKASQPEEESSGPPESGSRTKRGKGSDFHEECILKVRSVKKMSLRRDDRTKYVDDGTNTRFTCMVSKFHDKETRPGYWCSYHPPQNEYLRKGTEGYLILGCGSVENTLLIPFSKFKPWLELLGKTEKADRMYWHIVIKVKDGKYLLRLGKDKETDVTGYRI
ncbi:MAG: hypothetical protein GY757_16950 [bacterium]|nr:hypothetical protein [bacterium]